MGVRPSLRGARAARPVPDGQLHLHGDPEPGRRAGVRGRDLQAGLERRASAGLDHARQRGRDRGQGRLRSTLVPAAHRRTQPRRRALDARLAARRRARPRLRRRPLVRGTARSDAGARPTDEGFRPGHVPHVCALPRPGAAHPDELLQRLLFGRRCREPRLGRRGDDRFLRPRAAARGARGDQPSRAVGRQAGRPDRRARAATCAQGSAHQGAAHRAAPPRRAAQAHSSRAGAALDPARRAPAHLQRQRRRLLGRGFGRRTVRDARRRARRRRRLVRAAYRAPAGAAHQADPASGRDTAPASSAATHSSSIARAT